MMVSLQHCSCRESHSACIVGISGAGGELLLLQRLTGESSFSGNYEVEMFLGIGDLGDRLPQDPGRTTFLWTSSFGLITRKYASSELVRMNSKHGAL